MVTALRLSVVTAMRLSVVTAMRTGPGACFGTRPRSRMPRSGQGSLVKAHVWIAAVEGACWVSGAPFEVEPAVSSRPLDLLVSL